MYNKILISVLIIFISSVAGASEGGKQPKQMLWPFEGMFGQFDRQAAQRGAQVYIEVCAACHGVYNLYYRNLKDIGFSDAEVKQLALNYTVTDGPNAAGEMFERPATPSDRIKRPYPNEAAARASNNGAYPPDLSLIVKARHDGANHLYAILTGYEDPPKGMEMMPGLHYNPYFEGGQIAMPAPLMPNMVTYSDGTPATVEQMARDVVIFLQWAAEPEMEHRKSMGLKVLFFLSIFTVVFYVVKKKIWKKIE